MQLLLLTAGIYVGAQLAGVGTIDIHPFRQDRLPIWVAFAAVAQAVVVDARIRVMPAPSMPPLDLRRMTDPRQHR